MMSQSIQMTVVVGGFGPYRIDSLTYRLGSMPGIASDTPPTRLALLSGHVSVLPGGTHFALRGATGAVRYARRSEVDALEAVLPPLGRPGADRGALVAIRKTPAWWTLGQDERRAMFEERSQHVADGMRFLPAIAREVYHARELGEFYDFLAWFEFSEAHEPLFDELLALRRASEEWAYVDRELELRFTRED